MNLYERLATKNVTKKDILIHIKVPLAASGKLEKTIF